MKVEGGLAANSFMSLCPSNPRKTPTPSKNPAKVKRLQRTGDKVLTIIILNDSDCSRCHVYGHAFVVAVPRTYSTILKKTQGDAWP